MPGGGVNCLYLPGELVASSGCRSLTTRTCHYVFAFSHASVCSAAFSLGAQQS
jgi:hypothetical protein